MLPTTEIHKCIVGHVCSSLQRRCGRGAPRSFLLRNLKKVLDSNERLLKEQTDESTHPESIVVEHGSSTWEFPPHEILERLMVEEKPVLRIDTLQIRHPESEAGINKRIPEQPPDDHLDEQRMLDGALVYPCQVTVTVRDARVGGDDDNMIFRDSRSANVIVRQLHHRPHFDVELDQPFLIELEKLMVEEGLGVNGDRHHVRTVISQYLLEVTIQCSNPDNAVDLLSRLEGRNISEYRDFTQDECILEGSWDGLPDCPPCGHLLNLAHRGRHELTDMEFKVEVSMGWSRRPKSALVRYNRHCGQFLKASRQFAVPDISEDSSDTETARAIMYEFEEAPGRRVRRLIVQGLCCPICMTEEPFPSFRRLQGHLTNFHDHFDFVIEDGDASSENVYKIVHFSLADEQVPRPDPKRDINKNFYWIAPETPQELASYLYGQGNRAAVNSHYVNKRHDRTRGTRRGENYHRKLTERPPPDKVLDLPENAMKRKKHMAPYVPGVTFYHTLTKETIQQGEYISDSDDGVEQSWLARKRDVELRKLGLSDTERAFVTAFNERLDYERVTSHMHTRDAVIRFTRKHLEQLCRMGWEPLLRARLELLQDRDVIDGDTVAYCLGLIAKSRRSPSHVDMAGVGVSTDTVAGDLDESRM